MLVPPSPRRVFGPWLLAAICLLAAAPIVRAEGINLSWNECGTQGDALQSFACDANSGSPFELVASFVPPGGITQLTGVQGDIRASGMQFPDWWRLGSGQCRGFASLASSMNFTAGPTVCADPWNGLAPAGVSYVIGFYGVNTARIRVTGYMSPTTASLNTETEYYAFKVLIGRDKTTGSGSCSGCSIPMTLTLEQLQLFQAAGANPILTTAAISKSVSWQGIPAPPPAVFSFNPGSAPAGNLVTIGGSYFTGATSVRFDSTEALFSVIDDGQVTATVPQKTHAGPIRVTTPNGTGVSGNWFQPLPTLRYFVPRQAPVGEYVAIVGDNLRNVSEVTFNGTTALEVALRSDTLIQARVPEGATNGPIALRGGAATSASATSFTVGPWFQGSFDLAWNDCGMAGAALQTFACNTNLGTPFRFFGSFIPPPDVIRMVGFAATLRVGGDVLPDWWRFGPGQCRDAGSLLADYDFTAGPFTCRDAWAGSRVGSVQYDVGGYGPNTARLEVSAFGPPLAASPDSEYYAFRVTIGRSNSTGGSTCFGCPSDVAITLQQLELFQDEDLWFNPPPITAAIRHHTIEWQGPSVPKPDVWSFTPPGGAAGTSVRIVGTSFNTATSVTFGGKPAASFLVESDTVIHATAPESVLTSPVTVTSPTGSGTSPERFVGPPMISWFAPARARLGQTVHIYGYNLSQPLNVRFEGVLALFHSISEVALDAVVPPGATDGHLVVANDGGADSAAALFTVGTPQEPGINLAWDDCGAAGSTLKSWACDANNGPTFPLIASFVPPSGIASFTGVAAELRLAAQGALPEWWKHGLGSCRGTAGLQVSADFTAGPSTCVDPFGGGATGGHFYELYPDPNRVQLRVQFGLPAQFAGPLVAGDEHNAFRVIVLRTKTTGVPSCTGCLTPVCITLNEIKLLQENDPDVLLLTPLFGNSAFWQSQQNSCLALTPALASLVKSEAFTDRIHVAWELARGEPVTLYRREGEGEWRSVTRLAPDGTGRVEHVDREVRAGGTYAYRLGIVVREEEVFAGEVTLSVPFPARTLELRRILGDGGGVTATISIPEAGAATLEIYDPAGRRLASRRLEGLAPGEHEIMLPTRLNPGTYFGRLLQNGGAAGARFVVLR